MNSKLFAERLIERREAFGYKTRQAFVNAYDARYKKESDHSAFSTIRSYEQGEAKNPETEVLLNLSEMLNCSVDYLLGKTDYMNIGNKEICEITELSEDAVEVLRGKILPDRKWRLNTQTIETLLNMREFHDLVDALGAVEDSQYSTEHAQELKGYTPDEIHNKYKGRRDKERYLYELRFSEQEEKVTRFEASEALTRVMDKLSTSGIYKEK